MRTTSLGSIRTWLRVRWDLVEHALQEQVEARPSKDVDRLHDGRQTDSGVSAHSGPVKSHDRDVLRHAPTAGLELLDETDGHIVIGGHDRHRAVITFQEQRQTLLRIRADPAVDHPLGLERQAMSQERLLKGIEPHPARGTLDKLVRHIRDPPVPEVAQMSDRQLQTGEIIDRDAVQRGRPNS